MPKNRSKAAGVCRVRRDDVFKMDKRLYNFVFHFATREYEVTLSQSRKVSMDAEKFAERFIILTEEE